MATLAEFRLPGGARRTMRALASVVCTERVEELGIGEAVVDQVELFLASIPGPMRAGIVAGIYAFEHSARVTPGAWGRTFSALSDDAQEAHFQRWYGSKLAAFHQVARALKMFLTFAYYEHPRVQAGMGYDPEAWIAEAAERRQARFGEQVRKVEAELLAPDPLRETLHAGGGRS